MSALWVTPTSPISTTAVSGEFFPSTSCASGCEAFNIPASQVPVFLESFPDLLFTSSTRPFTDVALDTTGASVGNIVAQGNSVQAGVGTLLGFSAVFRGTFVVAQAGNYTFNVGSQDGFLFGVGNGAARVSGVNVNPPSSGLTIFGQYPVMGANNGPSTGSASPIVVTFPAAGSYPYEFDYRSGTGGALSLADSIRPLYSLALTSEVTAGTVGQSASLTVQALDETGSPIAQLPITVTVGGAASQSSLTGTTDSTGKATVPYTSSLVGVALLQASAVVNGLQLVSNQASVTWTVSAAPIVTSAAIRVCTFPIAARIPRRCPTPMRRLVARSRSYGVR